jgi:uncharacterized repeat protein (TIGR02543 family)
LVLFFTLTICAGLTHGAVLLDTGFEGSTSLPTGWTQSQISGSAIWNIQTGGNTGGNNPSSAHGGVHNATLYMANYDENKTQLISPVFWTAVYTNLSLTFWHTQAEWTPDQDTLKVFYSTDGGTNWSQLAYYTTSVAAWTKRTITLPTNSASSRIAFEGNAKYGFGVCLDDIQVTGVATAALPQVSVSITDASASEAGQDAGVWTLNRTGNTNGAVTVNFSLSGTATATNDYTISHTGSVTFAAGQTSVVVTLTPVDDAVYDELAETAVLTLESGSGYEIGTAAGTITIADNDVSDLQILIIGSTHDSSEQLGGNSKPFSPAAIGTELKSILSGCGLGAVNVAVVDRYAAGTTIIGNTTYAYNLASWFHWPFPKGAESNRWANLRGEAGIAWDYVILIPDPYTIEYTPGLFAYGAAKIAEEVAKGSAETVLLMPWPASDSSRNIAHYKDVVYRAGRSGGIKVAPGGLAWQAIKGSALTNPNPDNDGAFIAAASIYSTIFSKSATNSTYVYNDSWADTVNTTEVNNRNAKNYTGDFSFQNPYLYRSDYKRKIYFGSRGTSTEGYFQGAANSALGRCNVGVSSYCPWNRTTNDWANNGGDTPWIKWPAEFVAPIAWNDGRDGVTAEWWKSYMVNPTYWDFAYGYIYQANTWSQPVEDANDHFASTMFAHDNELANRMMSQGPSARILPVRTLWASIHKEFPAENPLMDNNPHMNQLEHEAVGTYMYTLYSGRCPLDPEPAALDKTWVARKIGYETAWRLGRCQMRAPGFKVMPRLATALTVTPTTSETITVQFILPPLQDVTVNVSLSNTNAAVVGSKQLVFTPQNYNVPQNVVVAGLPGSAASETFNVVVTTVSTDEVYNGLSDIWDYTINRSAPVSLARVDKGTTQVTANQNLPLTINLNTSGSISANTTLAGPSRGTTTWSGSDVIYTPGSDFLGKDGFSFAVNNAGSLSVGYIEITVTNAVSNGMVSYRGNGSEGGAVPIDANTYAQNATVTVLSNTGNLFRVGYNFDGWNTATNGSGTTYNASATFSMGASGMILYAKWRSVPTYTVYYNGNNNTSGSVPYDQTKTDGVNLTLASNIGTLARINYNFAGWNTAADGTGTNYAVGATYSGNSNLTLYAKWTLVTYAVNYNANSATSGTTPTNQTKTYGVNLTLQTNSGNLARTGYSFAGWNTAAAGTGTDYAPGATYSANAAVTLYAKWATGDVCNVSYDANGATTGAVPVDASSPYTNGATVTVLGNTGSLARAGYTFNNWNTATNGSGTSYTPAATFSISTNTTLYAQWTALPTYTVSYNGNGNTGGSAPSNDAKIQGINLTLPGAGTLVRTGYTFTNWNTATNGLGTSYAAGAAYTIDAAVTLYAQWTAVPTYNVTFSGNGNTGGTAPSNQTKTQGVNLTLSGAGTLVRTGYTFVNWNTAATGTGTSYAAGAAYATDAAVTLYAQWTVSTYSVTYNGNSNTGGTAPSSQTKTHDVSLTLATNTGDLTRTGYTFAGWNTAADGLGTPYASGASCTTNAALALYASWTANSYTVTFDGNGGVTPSPASTSVTFGSPYGTLATTSRTNYTFNGWFTAATGGTEVTNATVVTNASNHALYAQWLANTYVVSYQGNGNTSGTVPANQAKIHDINLTLAANSGSLVKTGYAFTGWNTETNGSGTAYASGATYSANAAVTLYAQWIAGTFLTWDANGTGAGQSNGGGAWEGSNLWWNGTGNQNWASGASAIFGVASTAGGAVTLASNTTVESLTFNQFSGTYTLGTAGQTLMISNGINMNASAGAATISSPIMFGGAQTWANNSTNLLTVSGVVSNNGHLLTFDGAGTISLTTALATGGGGITKNGAGRLQLSNAAQLYTGSTIVNGGVLSYGDNSSQLPTANITLNGGVIDQRWTADFTRALGASTNQIQLTGGASGFSNNNGGHTVRINNNAATEMVWGVANEAGNVLATGFFNPSKFVLQSAFSQGANTLTFANNIDLNGTTRTIQANSGLAGTSISTLSGVIRTSSGTAGLIKEGNGTLILAAANTYTGNTTISGGTLRVGNNTAGTLNSGNYAGNISIASGSTLQIWSSAAQILSGTISGGGGLHKAYAGALTLSGTNTYTGRTSFLPQNVAGFTVNITSFNSVNGGTPLMANSSLGAPTTVTNGTIDIGSGTAQAGVTLNYTGPGETTDRVINFGFNGGASQTLNASGSGLLKFTSAMTGNTITTQSGSLVLRGTGSGEITQALPALPSGGLSKNDSGAWTLGGTNFYTGPTAITAGKLFINGDQSSATGNVSVATNATLGGTGTIGGNTTIATGGRLEFNLSAVAGSHNGLDLASGRSLTFSGTSVLSITSSGGAAPGSYTLFTAPGGITGSAPTTLILPAGWAATASISGNSLLLKVTSVGWTTAYAQWIVGFYATNSVNDTQLSSNGVNTIREAYIIGLNPTNATGRFEISVSGAPAGSMALNWNSTSGRLYNVYWSTNLLGGAASFQLLRSNILWSANVFTNTEHISEKCGFYRIDVQLE